MASKTRGASPIFLDEEMEGESSNVIRVRSRGRRRIVFGWYGGKFSHLGWLLPLLPTCHHYCEPFSGSGVSVSVGRKESALNTQWYIVSPYCRKDHFFIIRKRFRLLCVTSL